MCAPGAHFTCFAITKVQILTAEAVVAVPAAALALLSSGSDPSSPRRVVATSPRRNCPLPTPGLNGAHEDAPILLAADEGGIAGEGEARLEEQGLRDADVGDDIGGRGWSTKLQAILDELEFVSDFSFFNYAL